MKIMTIKDENIAVEKEGLLFRSFINFPYFFGLDKLECSWGETPEEAVLNFKKKYEHKYYFYS